MSATRRPSLVDQVRGGLLEDLVSGKLAPGAKLPNENEIGERFGVSRATVREAVLGMLESLGYHVLYASNGPEALEILQEGEEVDLLFSDIVMPRGMTGVELAREAHRRRPDMKILLTSGFAGGRSGREPSTTPQTGEFPFLPKPYTVSDLARRLRETFRVPAAATPR